MPRSNRSVSLSQLRVGIFVLLAIGILVFLILNASGDINPFSKKLHLKARFADANGLRDGSEVRLAGVRVGKVDQITWSGMVVLISEIVVDKDAGDPGPAELLIIT